jgi:hypothetical protein
MARFVEHRHFVGLLRDSIERGLTAAALVDRQGNVIGLAGEISDEEAMPVVSLVLYREKSDDLTTRLFGGEILIRVLEDRAVAVGIAARQLFVVASMPRATPALIAVIEALRASVASALVDSAPPPPRGNGGSGSGPAGLPLVEYGITVPRRKMN